MSTWDVHHLIIAFPFSPAGGVLEVSLDVSPLYVPLYHYLQLLFYYYHSHYHYHIIHCLVPNKKKGRNSSAFVSMEGLRLDFTLKT